MKKFQEYTLTYLKRVRAERDIQGVIHASFSRGHLLCRCEDDIDRVGNEFKMCLALGWYSLSEVNTKSLIFCQYILTICISNFMREF